MSAPEEGLAARHHLEVAGVDPAPFEHRPLALTEVVTHDSNQPYLSEVAGRERKVHGRAAEHALTHSEGSGDAVECDRADDG